MVKKKNSKKAIRVVQRPPTAKSDNPFEQARNKKRFDVLGRKLKGGVRNVPALRSAAVEKRKSTLLVEYRQLKKSNAFIDRRFGEDDENLTQDDRALLRFQKQRLKELANSRFALPDAEGEGDGDGDGAHPEELTHLGKSLAELEDLHEGWSTDDDNDFDQNLDDEMIKKAHFGGGAKQTNDSENQVEPKEHRSKKEIMEEVIAKSKMHKALKSAQREDDLHATEALDEAWKALSNQPSLTSLFRPQKRSMMKEVNARQEGDDGDRRFDALTKELVFDARAAPSDRTLTAEELTELEEQRLQLLEKERLKRQKEQDQQFGFHPRSMGVITGGDDLEDDFHGGEGHREGNDVHVVVKGGYAARRAKRRKAAEDESSSEPDSPSKDSEEEEDSEEEDDGVNETKASGSHPLQIAFRKTAAALQAKYGVGIDAEDQQEEEEEGEGEEEESDEDEDDGSLESDYDGEDEHDQGDETDREEGLKKESQTEEKQRRMTAESSMSFTPPLPQRYEDFAVMMKTLSAKEVGEMVRRIRSYNAKSLAMEGRKKLQTLYGCIIQYFADQADMHPPKFDHLDALIPHILEITPQVPFYAATLARARIQKAHVTMMDRLRKKQSGEELEISCFPPHRMLLLLKLYTTVYPVTDKRHPVLTAASLFACSALAMCPIESLRDAGTGLFLANIVVHMHAQAFRWAPEPLEFAIKLLTLLGTQPINVNGDTSASLDFATVFSTDNGRRVETLDVESPMRVPLLLAALYLIRRIAEILVEGQHQALPEIMVPKVTTCLSSFISRQGGSFSGGAEANDRHPGAVASQILSFINEAISKTTSSRRPLFNQSLLMLKQVKQFNPRFEEDFVAKKDYDPDRERAERRRLQRQIRKEERGAARELRRDAAYMAVVRDKEKAALQAELDASARRAKAFLQEQAADFKSGGQKGMWKKRKAK